MTRLRSLLLSGAVALAIGGLSASSTLADDAAPPAAAAAPAAPAPAQTPAQAQTQSPETPAQPPAAQANPAQTPAPGATAEAPPPAHVDVGELMAPGPLPEISMGSDTAPVTIVEYHSMTCPHCAHFEKAVLPTLQTKYIDTGKVRLIMRSFPLNQLDAVAFMLLRCRPTDTYLANVKLMYDTQETWAFSDHPKEAITDLAKKIGFTQESFEACLKDQALWDRLVAVAKKADETFKVNGTPTFFINGTRVEPIASPDELDKVLAPFLKS